jgi:hypothetical protein
MPRPKTTESNEIPDLIAALDSSATLFGAYHPSKIAVVNRLAIAFWGIGDTDQAVGLLDQALENSASTLEREHPSRTDLLCTFGEIMVERLGSSEPVPLTANCSNFVLGDQAQIIGARWPQKGTWRSYSLISGS